MPLEVARFFSVVYRSVDHPCARFRFAVFVFTKNFFSEISNFSPMPRFGSVPDRESGKRTKFGKAPREATRRTHFVSSRKRDFYGCAMNDYNEKEKKNFDKFLAAARCLLQRQVNQIEEKNLRLSARRICMEMKTY